MASRSSHIIWPSAKLHVDNMGELEVTLHRTAIASAIAQCAHGALTSLSSPSLSTQVPDLDKCRSDNAPAPDPDSAPSAPSVPSHKRPLASC